MSIPKADTLSDRLVASVSELLLAETSAKRVDAARSLGQTKSKACVKYLIQALADDSAEVRLAAAEGLAEIGDPAGIEPLKGLLEKEKDTSGNHSALRGAIDKLVVAESVRRSQMTTAPRLLEASYQEIERTLRASAAKLRANSGDGRSGPLTREEESPGSAGPAGDLFSENPVIESSHEKRQNLEETYLRAAREPEVIEEARRRSNEEASRRTDEELRNLQAEEEYLANLKEDLARRRSQIEEVRRIATEESQRIEAIETRIVQDETARRARLEDNLRLEADTRVRLEAEHLRFESLQREAAEQRELMEEQEHSLARVRQLRPATEATYRQESDQLNQELAALQQANEQLSRLRAGVDAARQRSEEEVLRLREAHELIQKEEVARRAADDERIALEVETKVRLDEATRRLEEARRRDAESRRRIEEEARLRSQEDNRRLTELNALRKQREEEAANRAAQEEELKAQIEAIREATQNRLKAIEEAEAVKQSEAAAYQRAEEQAKTRAAETDRRRAEEDARLKAEYESWVRLEEEARRHSEAQRQMITSARLRAEEEGRRLEELEQQALLQAEQEREQFNNARLRKEQQTKSRDELSRLKETTEREAMELAVKGQELLTQIEVIRQMAGDHRRTIEANNRQLATAEEEFRLLELEKLTSAEAFKLTVAEQTNRLAELDAELDQVAGELRGQAERKVQLEAEIAALQLSSAEHGRQIEIAEAQRREEEEKIARAGAVLAEKQKQARQKAEQEEKERQDYEAATARIEEEARQRAKTEADRRSEQRKLQIEVEEKALIERNEELNRRRAEIDVARNIAEEEARRLAEIQARISDGETARRRAEHERLRLGSEVRLKAQREQDRLKETRDRIADAHKEIGELRHRAEEEERELQELRAAIAKYEKQALDRIKIKDSLTARLRNLTDQPESPERPKGDANQPTSQTNNR